MNPLAPPGMQEIHLFVFCWVRYGDWPAVGYWRYIMSLLDSYTGLVVSCMRGRFSRQGGVALVPWFVRCFRMGGILRFMFFLESVLL